MRFIPDIRGIFHNDKGAIYQEAVRTLNVYTT